MLLHFRNKKQGSLSSVLRYEEIKLKYKDFLLGFPVAMVTFYFTKTTETFSAIVDV